MFAECCGCKYAAINTSRLAREHLSAARGGESQGRDHQPRDTGHERVCIRATIFSSIVFPLCLRWDGAYKYLDTFVQKIFENQRDLHPDDCLFVRPFDIPDIPLNVLVLDSSIWTCPRIRYYPMVWRR